MKSKLKRSRKGQLTEFATAMLLFVCLLLPITDLCSLPLRYLFCQAMVSKLAATLAHCEKRSEAGQFLKQEQSWKATLAHLGISVSNEELELVASTSDGARKISLKESQTIPSAWLPDGPNAPYIYSIMLKADCGMKSGIFGPVSIRVSSDCPWENVSPNPKTLKYFIAE